MPRPQSPPLPQRRDLGVVVADAVATSGHGSTSTNTQRWASAGFHDVAIRAERETIRQASLDEYVPGYISATPVATSVASLDPEAQGKITADVREALSAYLAGDGVAAPIEAHLAIARR